MVDPEQMDNYLPAMTKKGHIRPIVTVPDPRLKLISTPVEVVTDEIRTLMDDMLATMYDAPGIGLAAIQVGVPLRVIVMDLAQQGEDPQPKFYVNPEILDPADTTIPYNEGCLSVPDIYDDVDRPEHCRVTYLDYNGERVTEDCEGLYAVCIQHEMDHLEGIVFLDHLSRLKRERAIKKVVKAERLAAQV